jgi:hypothetical protein
MQQHLRWLRWLAAWLKTVRTRCAAHTKPHRDGRAAFLRGQVQAEERLNASQTEERRLGGLAPLPTGQQPNDETTQTREKSLPAPPPPRRRL